MVVTPLRFGDRVLGLMELEHHKAGDLRRQAAGGRRALRDATGHDHPDPGVAPAAGRRRRKARGQLERLNDSARLLRGGADAVVQLAADINKGIGEEAEQATAGRTAADDLYLSTSAIARDAGEAAAASERSAVPATEHQTTVGTAVERLISAKEWSPRARR